MRSTPDLILRLRDQLGARLIETHISWVLVGDPFAYKIKKPLDLGFLDFSTLERRHLCCQEEVRLNRRLAPDIYLAVEPVTATGIGGPGEVLDWAVKMHAFDADATLDRAASVTPDQIDAIADRVAAFHHQVAVAPATSNWGSPDAVRRPVAENFRQIGALSAPPEAGPRLARLDEWSRAKGQSLASHFTARKTAGWVRECHGDLHLGNIAWQDQGPLIFDCIEFNPDLRYIDVASELAFLAMDLTSRGWPGLAWRALNRWLEQTGDYAGLAALAYYRVYRAMVRAKVNFIRASQDDAAALAEALRYLDLAEGLSRPARPALLLMHGVSGSGKSRLSQQVLEALGAVRLRSDVERKRLHGLAPLADSTTVPGGIYTEAAGRRTFDHLLDQARMLLDMGLPVIVDATFLKQAHRQPFLEMARKRAVPLAILDVRAPTDLLRDRVARRSQRRDDPSEAGLAVLESQLASREPLSPDEAALARVFMAEDSDDWPNLIGELARGLGSSVAVQPNVPYPHPPPDA